MSDRQNLHEFLARKDESAVQGEIAAQKRLSEADSDLEIRRWDQKNSEIALYESHRELESRRLQQHQADQWADQAQKEKLLVATTVSSREKGLERRNEMMTSSSHDGKKTEFTSLSTARTAKKSSLLGVKKTRRARVLIKRQLVKRTQVNVKRKKAEAVQDKDTDTSKANVGSSSSKNSPLIQKGRDTRKKQHSLSYKRTWGQWIRVKD